MERYVILTTGTSAARGGASDNALADARIEVAELSEKEVAETERDGSVGEVAPIVAMELIDHCEIGERSGDGCTDNDSWGIAAVGADLSGLTGAGVTVAVIDSGISKDHPAFDPGLIQRRISPAPETATREQSRSR
jgi:subtilisin family serine protease